MKKYSFIGAGNMAYAIIGGMGDSADITVYDKLTSQYGKFNGKVKIADSVPAAVKTADYIVLAVKPQNFKEVLAEIKDSGVCLDGKVFISIAAGVKTSSVCNKLGKRVPVIRTMPNTPLLIGKGVTALSRNEEVSDEAFDEITKMFSRLGKTLILPEDKMNAIICATSSAPAYIYHLIDCMIQEAKGQGLDGEDMLSAICETVKGSADMIMQSDKTPKELVRMVTSPNGTTERAMRVFYDAELETTVGKAMRACTERAEQLSDELDN
ncbi:MAG: pyrroline-5-carboxylate reductase [Clostridia bacterium]|nr:pyrroline-5-carboxylate reductase [Clostridia bacterium]